MEGKKKKKVVSSVVYDNGGSNGNGEVGFNLQNLVGLYSYYRRQTVGPPLMMVTADSTTDKRNGFL